MDEQSVQCSQLGFGLGTGILMATNQQTLLRQWHMLRLVPRFPGKITAQQIKTHLADEEFDVTERTIQRDLNELSQVFPLTVDDRDKPFGWSWQQHGANFDLPRLEIPEALTLLLVEQHLRNFLPPTTLDHLKPYFQAAAKTLDLVCRGAGAKAWLNKIRAVPAMQPLTPPALSDEVQRIVYEALLLDRQLNVVYRKRTDPEPQTYSVQPLAVVQRGPVLYLICTILEYTDVRLLAIHRIQSAEITDRPVRPPKGFSVDSEIAAGIMGFGGASEIRLEAAFDRERAEHLRETPLNASQRLEDLDDGRVNLSAAVIDTSELRWWLLAFGEGVEVIAPPALRKAIAESTRKAAAQYQR
jgi:predicted DNA-binding transcriptional regulator YafY